MLITHYIGNPVAYKQKVGIVCGIANFFIPGAGVLLFFQYPVPLIIAVGEG